MSAGRLVPVSYAPARDRYNRLVPGARITVWGNRTTTKAAIFADSGLTTPLANPVQANSSGLFPAIWAEGGTAENPLLYSWSITDADGASIGNPNTFDDWALAFDADQALAAITTAAANSAAESAATASEAAAESTSALDEIMDLIANAPDAPSVVNKANRDGGNITDPNGWRNALDLGDAAVLTVAAGDDERIVEVASKLNKLSTLADLEAFPASRGQVFVKARAVISDGYSGVFEWVSGDQSGRVSSDPLKAIWVAPDGGDGSAGAWKRVFDGAAQAEWFGASSTADSGSILNAMAATVGYIRLGGPTRIGSAVTLDAPIFVGDGAYFTVDAGVTLSITSTLTSPNQWIFRGDGDIAIPLPDVDSGEDVRELKAIWFGAFTQVPNDQAPRIQKAINALGNSREGVVCLDCGSYQVESGMTVGRGVKISSMAGPRRSVFEVVGDGYPVFRTLQTACTFSEIQFENFPAGAPSRVSPYILIDHDYCEVRNIFHQSSKYPVVVNGARCKVGNVEGVYGGANPGADSAQVLIRAEGCAVEGVWNRFSTAFGPKACVEIGTGASGTIVSFYVRNVETRYGSIPVLINADNITVARGQIRDLRYTGATSPAEAMVKIKTSGAGNVFGVSFNGLTGSNQGAGLVKIEQGSTGSTHDLLFDDIYDAGTTGVAFDLVQAAGSLRGVRVGANVISDRPNLITSTGVVAGVRSGVKRRIGKTASFSIPASGAEDGATYNVVSGQAVTATLPAEALEPLSFSISSTGTGITTLTAASGALINGGATFPLAANRLYQVTVARNVAGTAAQWVVNG